jgi:hypothetical protein
MTGAIETFRAVIEIEKEDGTRTGLVADVHSFVHAHIIGAKHGTVLHTSTPECPLFGEEPSAHHDEALCLHCQDAAADPAGFARELRRIDSRIRAIAAFAGIGITAMTSGPGVVLLSLDEAETILQRITAMTGADQ